MNRRVQTVSLALLVKALSTTALPTKALLATALLAAVLMTSGLLPASALAQVRLGAAVLELQFDTNVEDPIAFGIAANDNDDLGFAFHNLVDENLYYRERSGATWNARVTVDADGSVGRQICIDFDDNGFPHLAYASGVDVSVPGSQEFPLYTVRRNTNPTGGFATRERIDPRDESGNFIELAVDGLGVPHVTYRQERSGSRRATYARRVNDNWVTEDITTGNNDRIRHSIAVDSSNNPHISMRNGAQDRMVYAHKNPGWGETTVDSGTGAGRTTFIALEDGDPSRIGIAYGHSGETRLKLASNRTGSWQDETIRTHTSGRETRGVHLVFDQNDAPHVAHQERDLDGMVVDNSFIGYSEKTTGTWRRFDVDTGEVGGVRMIFDSTGKLTLYYMKRTATTTKRYFSRRVFFAPTCDAGGPYTGVIGQSINFDGAANDPDGFITDYTWNFGDGSSDGGQTPSHTYTMGGNFTVTLTVADDDGETSTCTTTCTINAPPVCDPGGPYAGLAGATINFDGSGSSDPGGSIQAYEWDFGDGSLGSGAMPTHVYTFSGQFTVTLCVTDNAGAQSCCATTATIGAPPICNAGPSASGDVGQSLGFDGTGSSDPDGTIQSYAWSFGDGFTGGGATASHTYTAGGNYTVTLTVTDNEALTSSCATMATINALPVCDAGGPYSGDAGVTISFDGSGSSDADGTISSYAWDFGDGMTGSGVAPTHSYATALLFTVTLCVTDNDGAETCCQTTTSIGDAPQPPTCDAGGPYGIDAGAELLFDGSGSADADGTIQTYAWQFGDGQTGSGVNPTHTYPDAGTYTVTLTVTDDDALSTSCSSTAAINALPICDANGTYSARPGENITFDGSGSSDPDGTIQSYAWDFGDLTAGVGISPTHSYAAAGAYTVTLCVTDEANAMTCCSSTANIAANPPPVCNQGGPYSGEIGELINFDGSGSTDTGGGSITTFEWIFGDGSAANGAMQTHAYTQAGSFTVTLCVTDNELARVCCETTATIADTTQAQEITSVVLLDSDGALSFQIRTNDQVQTMAGSFRQGGAAAFQSLGTLTPTVMGSEILWSVAFPQQNATARGIEYFLDYQVGGDPRSFGTTTNPRRLTITLDEPGVQLLPRIYRMVSSPVEVTEPGTIAEQMSPFLGEPGDFSWRMGHFDPTSTAYVDVGDITTTFEFGKAYWMIATENLPWTITGSSRFPDAASGRYEIALQPGWNMVGNPTGYRITLGSNELMIRDGNTTTTFGAASTGDDPLVFRGIKVFDGTSGNYIEPPTLAKFNGCWILNRTQRTLTLLVPATEATGSSGRDAEAAARRESLPAMPWRLTMTAEAAERGGTGDAPLGGLQHATVELGLARTAADGYDALDAYAPPPVLDAKLVVGLRSAEPFARQRSILFERDVRSIESSGLEHEQVWELEVATDTPAVLRWDDPLVTGNGGLATTLVLERDEARFDMAHVRSIELPAGRETLRIIATIAAEPSSAPATPGLWAVANPNPFRTGTTLTVGVPAAGTLELRAYDVSGRLVWSRASRYAAGEHAIAWNGRDQGGAALAAGTYFVRLVLTRDDGAAAPEIAVYKTTLMR